MGDAFGQAELPERRGGVAAADDRRGVGRGHRLGDRARPGRERRELEGAHRAVPEHGAGAGDLLAIGVGGARAHVETHPAVGDVDSVERAALGVGVEGLAEDEVHGQAQLRAAAVEQLACGLEVLLGAQRVADRVPLDGEEREGHRAADEDRVGALQEGLEHADLVRHLGPADDRHERARGILEDAGERAHLALEQQARGARQQVATPSVEACARCAEPKASLTYASARPARRCASSGSFFVSPGSKRMFSSMTTSPSGTWSRARRGELHLGLQQLAQPRGHGSQ